MKKRLLAIAIMITTLISATANAARNPYNEEPFINPSNGTVIEVATSLYLSLEDFLATFELPADMPGDTTETVAFYNLTLRNYAKTVGYDVETLISLLQPYVVIELTPDTLYKDFEKSIRIKDWIGDMTFEEFKTIYNPDDSITEDSFYGEVVNIVGRKTLKENGHLGYFELDSILVMLEGKYLDFDVAPMNINDRVLVPVRAIFEALGATVSWDDETKTVFAKKGDTYITMQVGQNNFFVNSEAVALDTPAVIINDRTLVPIRAISEALDRDVAYVDSTKTVVIH